MIFKTMQKIGIFILTTAMFAGCSEFLKGKPAKQETIEIKSDDIACLKNISNQFDQIFQGQSNSSDIESTFLCLDQTLNQFQSRVEGKANANSFTAEELFIFFEKFQKETKLSKQAVIDMLILKKALFGGSDEVITKMEITDLRSYLTLIKQEAKKLLPYIKMFSFKKELGPFSRLNIDSGFLQLRSSLKILLNESKLGKSNYEFAEFKKLLNELNFVQHEQKELLDLVEKVKMLLVGTDSLNNNKDYESAIDNLSEMMIISSYVLHGDVQFEIKSEKQLSKALDFVDSFIAVLVNSVQFQKHSKIEISALDPMVEVILKKNISPFQLSVETFKTFYKKIVIKVFSHQKNMSINDFDSIRLTHIRSIQKEIAIFKLAMDFTNSNGFKNDLDRKNIKNLRSQIQNFSPQSKINFLSSFNAEEKTYIMDGFNDLKNELISARPVTYRFKKMVLAVNQEIWDMSWEDLSRAFYGNILARELLRGWGDSNTITESGFVQWYTDFKSFAIETKTFDPRSDNVRTGKETFLQANLFTFAGNGDNQINKSEAFQYVNMLASGGNQTFQEIRDGLTAAGCNLPEKDVFGYPWNNEKCFYENFKNNYKYYYSNLSYLVAYLDKLSETEFKNYYDSLMSVARYDIKAVGRIESADIRVLNMTLMYIESLFSVYDTNNNWTLSPAEIRIAYPRFKNFVTDYAHKNAKKELNEWDVIINPCRPLYPLDSFISEAFIFLAYNGRLPKKADVNDPSSVANIYECGKYQLGFASSYQPFIFQGEIDRKSIINTFKVLKSALDSQ